jgi:hypothetical protein
MIGGRRPLGVEGESHVSRTDRMNLIREIEAARGSRLLVVIWGDREGGLQTIIAPDAHAVCFQNLESMGHVEKLDVLLYTQGGQTLAAWGLANLVREYCDNLSVLIPHRALSAGTLFTLAADEIIMSRLGQLSPIDPSITSPLGPTVPIPAMPGQQQIVPISVEDVIGFIALATDAAGLKEERSILSVFDRLSSQVHPMALGAVYRSREQIVSLADRLLSFHMKGDEEKEDRERIVTRLTREMGSHDYLIGRTEAKNFLKLKVADAPADLEQKIMALFEEYSNLLELRQPFNPDAYVGANQNATCTLNRAIVESTEVTTVFRTIMELERVQMQMPMMGVPGLRPAFQERRTFESWITDQSV